MKKQNNINVSQNNTNVSNDTNNTTKKVGRKKGIKNKNNISVISVKLLELLKKNPNKVVTYEMIRNGLTNVLSNTLSDNDKLKYIKRAIKILKDAGLNVEKIDKPRGYVYNDPIYTLEENIFLFSSAKSGLLNHFKKSIYDLTRFDKLFDNSKYFVYSNKIQTISIDNIDSLNKIIYAIENKKYLSFTVNYKSQAYAKKMYYKPLGILVDDNYNLYLATIFQFKVGLHYILDFIPLNRIYNVKIENISNNYITDVEKMYKNIFPLYKEFYSTLFDKNNLEVLVDIFKSNYYGYNHRCLLRLYNQKYVDELEIKFNVYTEVSKYTDRGTIYYSDVYYENEDDFFDWIYHKYKIKDLAEKNNVIIPKDYSYNVEFADDKVRQRYYKYEINKKEEEKK